MGAVEIIFGIVLLLFALAIIIVVLLPEGHQQASARFTGGRGYVPFQEYRRVHG